MSEDIRDIYIEDAESGLPSCGGCSKRGL